MYKRVNLKLTKCFQFCHDKYIEKLELKNYNKQLLRDVTTQFEKMEFIAEKNQIEQCKQKLLEWIENEFKLQLKINNSIKVNIYVCEFFLNDAMHAKQKITKLSFTLLQIAGITI